MPTCRAEELAIYSTLLGSVFREQGLDPAALAGGSTWGPPEKGPQPTYHCGHLLRKTVLTHTHLPS